MIGKKTDQFVVKKKKKKHSSYWVDPENRHTLSVKIKNRKSEQQQYHQLIELIELKPNYSIWYFLQQIERNIWPNFYFFQLSKIINVI